MMIPCPHGFPEWKVCDACCAAVRRVELGLAPAPDLNRKLDVAVEALRRIRDYQSGEQVYCEAAHEHIRIASEALSKLEGR